MNIINWFLTNPLKTILIIIFGGCAIETFLIEPLNSILQMNNSFTIIDMMSLGGICLILGIYCMSTINKNPKDEEIKEI